MVAKCGIFILFLTCGFNSWFKVFLILNKTFDASDVFWNEKLPEISFAEGNPLPKFKKYKMLNTNNLIVLE